MKPETKTGLGLLIGGAAAYVAGLTPIGAKYQTPLTIAGLGAMAVGVYYLIFKSGGDAHGDQAGGLAGNVVDAAIGGIAQEDAVVVSQTPTVKPAPGTPTLPKAIPFTGRLLAPSPGGGTVRRLPFRQVYELLLLIENHTGADVEAPLEVQAEETGTYGGKEKLSRVIEGVRVPAGKGVHQVVAMPTSAGAFSNSFTLATFKFAGHHITTTHYIVE